MKKSKMRASILVMMLVVVTMFSGCGSKKSSTKEYEKGTIDGNTYESEFLNLKFTAPEGYTMLTEDVMAQYAQFTSDIIYKDKDQTEIDYAKAVTVYEMMAQESTNGAPNVNIVLENLLGKEVSVADYVELSKQQLQTTGIEYTFDDATEEVELAGEKYTMLNCVGTYSGQELQQQLYFRKVGGRMMLLTVTYTADTADAKDTLLAGFVAYK